MQDAAAGDGPEPEAGGPDWQRRVVGRSLGGARKRSIDRGAHLIRAAARVLERKNGDSLTVQDVADEAGQSLRTLYQYFASKDDLLLAVFEEAMGAYVRITRAAIEPLADPDERLAGALLASARMRELHAKAGVDRGLSNLRVQLGHAQPELVARSQAPVTELFRELVTAARPDGAGVSAESATYFVSVLRTVFALSSTLGNDYAVELPDVVDLAVFCLAGLGIDRPRAWYVEVDARLALSGSEGRSILRKLAKSGSA